MGRIRGWFAWYRTRDRTLSALRRAARTAILLPLLFVLGLDVLGSSVVALFASFGVFAMGLLVDIEGTRVQRVQGQLLLTAVGAVIICLGTLASRTPWLAALGMLVVGFCILFGAVISSAIAATVPALLLSFILPASLAGPASQIPDRVLGWVLAGFGATLASAFLWPAPAVEPLRARSAAACRALAAAVASSSAAETVDATAEQTEQRDADLARAADAVEALRGEFISTPYRPSGLASEARALLGLVDQLTWIQAVLDNANRTPAPGTRLPLYDAAKSTVAEVLQRCADLLADPSQGLTVLEGALEQLDHDVHAFERAFGGSLPRRLGHAGGPDEDLLMHAFDRTFRLQEIAFGTVRLGRSVAAMALAERRTWTQRMLGHDPADIPSPARVAGGRLRAHLTWRSVWLRNSVRGSVALSIATYIATAGGLQHGFWVVLGTMSVLRSNALSTGQNVLRAVLGTTVGFLVGSLVVLVIGSSSPALWVVLPVAILFAGIAPAAISYAAGQAGFTVMVVVLFNLLDPVGWSVGAVRVEDVAIGGAVSLLVGVLFWPRGATAVLEDALADAYEDGGSYLTAATRFAADQCGATGADDDHPVTGALDASRLSTLRLDDAFRTYLNERGSKKLALSDVAALISGVTRLRLATDWTVALWEEPGAAPPTTQGAVRTRLDEAAVGIEAWFDHLAKSLRRRAPNPGPVAVDHRTTADLLDPVRDVLESDDETAPWTAVRIGWTADLLDAVRLLQSNLADAVTRTDTAA